MPRKRLSPRVCLPCCGPSVCDTERLASALGPLQVAAAAGPLVARALQAPSSVPWRQRVSRRSIAVQPSMGAHTFRMASWACRELPSTQGGGLIMHGKQPRGGPGWTGPRHGAEQAAPRRRQRRRPRWRWRAPRSWTAGPRKARPAGARPRAAAGAAAAWMLAAAAAAPQPVITAAAAARQWRPGCWLLRQTGNAPAKTAAATGGAVSRQGVVGLGDAARELTRPRL